MPDSQLKKPLHEAGANQPVFVDRPTQRASVAQGLFKVGPGAGAGAQTRPAFLKCLGPRRHSPKERHLRRQAINLAPPMRVKAWGKAP